MYDWHTMHTSKVTQKGQSVIPAPLRRKLGFEQGTKVVIVETDGGVEVRPLEDTYFEQFTGVLSGEGRATQALLDERTQEKARGDTSVLRHSHWDGATRIRSLQPMR